MLKRRRRRDKQLLRKMPKIVSYQSRRPRKTRLKYLLIRSTLKLDLI